jgi:hypothetical protein
VIASRAPAASLAVTVAAAACAAWGCCRRAAPPLEDTAVGAVLRVPRAAPAPVLDGDNDDPGWTRAPGPARTGPFLDARGAATRPHSDARLLWGDGQLYLLLYAADDDIRARGDAFRIRVSRGGRTFAIEVSADGAIREAARDARGVLDPSWRSGAHVSREIDGTLDDARDTDEEWSLEMALPLAPLGLKGEPGEVAGFAIERCDASSTGERSCGAWAGVGLAAARGRLVLD